MRTLFNTSILVGLLVSFAVPAWAQEADPIAAEAAAQDAAAEAASMGGNADMSLNPQAVGDVYNTPMNVMPMEPASFTPAPPSDQRIKQLSYDEGDVYTITTKYGYQTNIVFSPKEDIETISVGDKSVWQIIPSGNRIFIRPMEEDVITNMTVLTNKRSYQFDLKSLGPAQNEGNIYVATFIYPQEIIAAAQAAAAAAQAAQQQQQPYGYNPAMYGGAPAVDLNSAPAYPSKPAGMIAPPPMPPQLAPAPLPEPASAPVSQGMGYTTPVYAAPVAQQPLPANVPFGGPTPPVVLQAAEPVAKAGKQETKLEKLARLNSEPSPPTQYYEIPMTLAPAPVAAPVLSSAASVPFGGPTPPPTAIAPVPVEVIVPPVNANFNYTYTGADALAPLQVYDDGRATYLKYAGLTGPLPEAYTLDASGQVVQLAHAMHGEYMVIEAVAPEIILKNADGSVHVYNESLSPKP